MGDLDGARCVAAIGGGGKTSALDLLARERVASGGRVIRTTTTRIWPPEGVPVLAAREVEQQRALLLAARRTCPAVTLVRGIDADGKLLGLSPDDLCTLFPQAHNALWLVEADGSKGRPLKAHGLGEPVIPACADLLLIVLGAWSFGQTADTRSVHRLEWLEPRTGHASGSRIDADLVMDLVLSYRQFVPETADVRLVINGARTGVQREIAREAISAITQSWPGVTATPDFFPT